MILEFLAEHPELGGGKVKVLPTEGNVSALNIPHASMVFDLHDKTELTAELLDGEGLATETVRYANIVSFTCLKRSEEHTSELQSLMRISYAVFCLKKKKTRY